MNQSPPFVRYRTTHRTARSPVMQAAREASIGPRSILHLRRTDPEMHARHLSALLPLKTGE